MENMFMLDQGYKDKHNISLLVVWPGLTSALVKLTKKEKKEVTCVQAI